MGSDGNTKGVAKANARGKPATYLGNGGKGKAQVDKGKRKESKGKVGKGKATCSKCARCWNYRESVGQNETHPGICSRCVEQLKE